MGFRSRLAMESLGWDLVIVVAYLILQVVLVADLSYGVGVVLSSCSRRWTQAPSRNEEGQINRGSRLGRV